LISEHDKKFGLLAIGSVFNHPRRDLGGLVGSTPARASGMPVLPASPRGSDCPSDSDASRGKQE
jgi:hypothetical protein